MPTSRAPRRPSSTAAAREARRAARAARLAAAQGERDALAADLRRVLTDEHLRAWAARHAVDLTDRDQLLRAAAVGLTVTLWRNTSIEDVHHGQDTCPDRGTGHPIPALNGAGDPSESDRITSVVAHAPGGGGIPDDVMARLNAATADQVYNALDATVPDEVTVPGAHVDHDPDLPAFLGELVTLLTDPDRTVVVGPCPVRIGDLLGDQMDDLVDDVAGKLTRLLLLVDAVGVRPAVWLAAVFGLRYAGHWYPHPRWADAVTGARALAMRPDAGDQLAPLRAWAPDVDDETFWAVLTHSPNLLAAHQVQWLIRADLTAALRPADLEGQATPPFPEAVSLLLL